MQDPRTDAIGPETAAMHSGDDVVPPEPGAMRLGNDAIPPGPDPVRPGIAASAQQLQLHDHSMHHQRRRPIMRSTASIDALYWPESTQLTPPAAQQDSANMSSAQLESSGDVPQDCTALQHSQAQQSKLRTTTALTASDWLNTDQAIAQCPYQGTAEIPSSDLDSSKNEHSGGWPTQQSLQPKPRATASLGALCWQHPVEETAPHPSQPMLRSTASVETLYWPESAQALATATQQGPLIPDFMQSTDGSTMQASGVAPQLRRTASIDELYWPQTNSQTPATAAAGGGPSCQSDSTPISTSPDGPQAKVAHETNSRPQATAGIGSGHSSRPDWGRSASEAPKHSCEPASAHTSPSYSYAEDTAASLSGYQAPAVEASAAGQTLSHRAAPTSGVATMPVCSPSSATFHHAAVAYASASHVQQPATLNLAALGSDALDSAAVNSAAMGSAEAAAASLRMLLADLSARSITAAAALAPFTNPGGVPTPLASPGMSPPTFANPGIALAPARVSGTTTASCSYASCNAATAAPVTHPRAAAIPTAKAQGGLAEVTSTQHTKYSKVTPHQNQLQHAPSQQLLRQVLKQQQPLPSSSSLGLDEDEEGAGHSGWLYQQASEALRQQKCQPEQLMGASQMESAVQHQGVLLQGQDDAMQHAQTHPESNGHEQARCQHPLPSCRNQAPVVADIQQALPIGSSQHKTAAATSDMQQPLPSCSELCPLQAARPHLPKQQQEIWQHSKRYDMQQGQTHANTHGPMLHQVAADCEMQQQEQSLQLVMSHAMQQPQTSDVKLRPVMHQEAAGQGQQQHGKLLQLGKSHAMQHLQAHAVSDGHGPGRHQQAGISLQPQPEQLLQQQQQGDDLQQPQSSRVSHQPKAHFVF